MRASIKGFGFLLAALPLPAMADVPANPVAERVAPDRLKLSWADRNGVDVYMADRADAGVETAKLVSANDRDGTHELAIAPGTRPFFLLRDHKDGSTARVAERLVPLEHGSNFRDIGGYATADGKHVRWGMIYRSGATPLLTDGDKKTIADLKLANMVDLRSSDERQLAPSRIYGVPYHAVGYSMTSITNAMRPSTPAAGAQALPTNGGALYRRMPQMLAPQLKLVFDRLLQKEGPLVYNCSAGQDRTGVATALILSALGVPRDTIIADYHLSTGYRHPEYEMPKFDPAAYPDNAAAQMFGQFRNDPAAAKPRPLKEADGTAFLSSALDEIDKTYGSVPAYLDKELGVSAVDIAALRTTYLE